eukprot:gene15515-biopygen21717
MCPDRRKVGPDRRKWAPTAGKDEYAQYANPFACARFLQAGVLTFPARSGAAGAAPMAKRRIRRRKMFHCTGGAEGAPPGVASGERPHGSKKPTLTYLERNPPTTPPAARLLPFPRRKGGHFDPPG